MNFIELLPLLFINLQSLYKRNIKIDGLTFPQLLAIFIIPHNGIEMSNLSKKVGVDISTLSRLIKGLEKKKLINRFHSHKDKRVIKIMLSLKSIKIKKNLEKQFDSKLLEALKQTLLDDKVVNLKIIDIRKKSDFADFIILGSGTSNRHIININENCWSPHH